MFYQQVVLYQIEVGKFFVWDEFRLIDKRPKIDKFKSTLASNSSIPDPLSINKFSGELTYWGKFELCLKRKFLAICEWSNTVKLN